MMSLVQQRTPIPYPYRKCHRSVPAFGQPTPNVLFIAVDDLRPGINCYGATWMKTPHMDRLAASSRVFSRHYVQVATCGASRHALLTGLRPRKETDYGNGPFKVNRTELAARETESFPHFFK